MAIIAYYRTRPSEPEASGLALSLQRQAAHEAAGGHHEITAEYIEREGEPGAEAYPAYAAAVNAANGLSAHDGGRCVQLIIATRAAVSSGLVFNEPQLRTEGGGFVLTVELLVPTIPPAPTIALPPGAPAPLCLHAEWRPRQLDTLIYLCNAAPQPLTAATALIDTIDDYAALTSKRINPRPQVVSTCERRLGAIPTNTGLWLGSITHAIDLERSTRYRLAYIDAAGRRRFAEARDDTLGGVHSPAASRHAWVAFEPARPAELPARTRCR